MKLFFRNYLHSVFLKMWTGSLSHHQNKKGRDFGIILACLSKLGYIAEWRVINASQYGGAQKRKRTFIFAYKNDTRYALQMNTVSVEEIISNQGFMAKAFSAQSASAILTTVLDDDISEISNNFAFDYHNAGYMKNNKVYTAKVVEDEEPATVLFEILETDVDSKYSIPDDKYIRLEYLKGSKRIPRKSKTGFEYIYSEGAVTFPDKLNQPARTMLTSEGTINRSSHVIPDPQTNKLRTITPVETERIQGFDDNWTVDMPDRMRYFCMGNALVVPMVTRMASVLDSIIDNE